MSLIKKIFLKEEGGFTLFTMADINLDGYTRIGDGNCLYLKNGLIKKTHVVEVIISRFVKQVAENQVVDAWVDAADRVYLRKRIIGPSGINVSGLTDFEKELIHLPDEILLAISQRNEGYVAIIKANTSTQQLKDSPPKKYVRFFYGYVPHNRIASREGDIAELQWYTGNLMDPELQSEGLGARLSLELTLEEGETLPNRDHVSTLLGRGTWGDPVLRVQPEHYDRSLALKVQETIYDGLGEINPGNFKDTSKEALEESLLQLLAAFKAIVKRSVEDRRAAQQKSGTGRILLVR